MNTLKYILPLLMSASLVGCNGNGIASVRPLPSSDSSPSSTPSGNPGDTSQSSENQGLFSSALSKRPLPLPDGETTEDGDTNNANGSATTAPNAAPAPQAAESAAGAPAADIAVGESRMIAPYFGGGPFNQYVVKFAEDITFAGSTETTLLGVHNQRIKGILSEWDKDARLLESRGQSANNGDIEYVQVLGPDAQPLRIQPRWTFRYSSTPRKETLNIYVTEKETRVHRLVWGEPDVDMSQVKVDSTKALSIAEEALENKTLQGPMIYPQANSRQAIIYEIPNDAKWRFSLNQNGSDTRYYVSVNFGGGGTSTTSTIAVGEPRPDIEHVEDFQFYASAEIDAATGKIISLNRPVDWRVRETKPLPEPVEPPPPPMPLPDSPDAEPSVGAAG